MPGLPKTPNDVLRLADWLELQSLTSDDGSASHGDLQAALSQGSILEPNAPHEPDAFQAVESLVLAVFDELEQRSRAGQEGYPFSIDLPRIVAPDNWQRTRSSYIYCLSLSYYGPRQATPDGRQQRRTFEYLAVHAAKRYLPGEAIRFASPRNPTDLPTSFSEAVNELCRTHLLEGAGYRSQPTLSAKDKALDVVAWRHAHDRLPGKLILFANCASGRDWESKVDALQPNNFWGDWMAEAAVSQIVKAIFIPHRVDRKYWDKRSRAAGIIFDRCRIAALVPSVPRSSQFTGGWPWAISVIQNQQEH